MPKLKTSKAVAKRLRITRTGKIIKRSAGQDHFNANEGGKKKRNKRSDRIVSATQKRNIAACVPYSAHKII